MTPDEGLSSWTETPQPGQHLVQVLVELTAACSEDVVLWRGAGLNGRDVDVLIAASDLRHATGVLLRHRMVPRDARNAWGAWVDVDGTLPPIDLLARDRWPLRYQSVSGVLQRLVRRSPMPTVASEDLLLILASDALAGRDLTKVRSRVAEIAERDPGARPRAEHLARGQGSKALLRAITDPVLTRGDRSGRLPFLTACRIGLPCEAGRRALRDRLVKRAAKRLLRIAARRRDSATQLTRRPSLIAVSGMDGSGKTTLAAALQHHLVTEGTPAVSSWARLGNETRILESVAQPIKRLMRRKGTIADPVVTAGPRVGKQQHPRAATGRRGPVEWTWTLLVAVVAARTQRRRTHPRREGVHVVCDRWTVDTLVDLELRYGLHRVAALVIKLLSPQPDLTLLLEVDAAVALRRKPDDKTRSTLEDMQSAYALHAQHLGLICLDASQPEDEVLSQARLLVDAATRGRIGTVLGS